VRELLYLILFLYPSYRVLTISWASFPFYLDRSSMLGNEERRVKARHEITQYYERRKVVTRRELPRADMIIEGEPSAAREEASSEDYDVEDETYVPSPRAQPHSRGKGVASDSGGGSGL
jgi:hypothetical protein